LHFLELPLRILLILGGSSEKGKNYYERDFLREISNKSNYNARFEIGGREKQVIVDPKLNGAYLLDYDA
jgi:hypothetical protein